MTKRNTAGDFGSPKWKEDFLTEESLDSIIDSTDIEDYEFHRIEKSYTVDDDRVGAIVQIKKDRRILRVIIDFKRGYGTWNQIMDMQFNLGNDCDNLIAVHGDNPEDGDEEDLYYDSFVAKRLIEVLIAYGVEFCIVTAKSQSEGQGQVRYKYSHDDDLKLVSEKFKTKLPSKRIFEETEFMLFCWGGDMEWGNDRCLDISAWHLERGKTFRMGIIVLKDLDLFSTWSDRGLFLNAAPKSEEGISKLEWIWKNKRKELRKGYKDCKIRMIRKDERPSKLVIRLLDKPFKELVHAEYYECYVFGDFVYHEESRFGEVMKDLLGNMPSMKKAVNGQRLIVRIINS